MPGRPLQRRPHGPLSTLVSYAAAHESDPAVDSTTEVSPSGGQVSSRGHLWSAEIKAMGALRRFAADACGTTTSTK